MAGVANFSLRFLAQHFVGRPVHFVTIVARHATGVVLAAIPVVAFAVFVTSQALPCTLFVFRHFEGAFLEDNVWGCAHFGHRVALDVLVAGTMTRLAIRRLGVALHTVLGLIDIVLLLFDWLKFCAA